MTHVVTVKPRTRAGSYSIFEARYRSLESPKGETIWEWAEIPKDTNPRRVWTVVTGDNGNLYIVPGLATVNFFGRIVTQHGWSDIELKNPGYVY